MENMKNKKLPLSMWEMYLLLNRQQAIINACREEISDLVTSDLIPRSAVAPILKRCDRSFKYFENIRGRL